LPNFHKSCVTGSFLKKRFSILVFNYNFFSSSRERKKENVEAKSKNLKRNILKKQIEWMVGNVFLLLNEDINIERNNIQKKRKDIYCDHKVLLKKKLKKHTKKECLLRPLYSLIQEVLLRKFLEKLLKKRKKESWSFSLFHI